MEKFSCRHSAGVALAKALKPYIKTKDTLVLGLPRGGIPVAYEIAKYFDLAMDVLVVRKLGVPSHRELAFGAITKGGKIIFNQDIIDSLEIPPQSIKEVINLEEKELARRELKYRNSVADYQVFNKHIILVDDGIATGASMKAAIETLRQERPASITVAVPVAAGSLLKEIVSRVDNVICLLQPADLEAVGCWYRNFEQTTDNEVVELMKKTKRPS